MYAMSICRSTIACRARLRVLMPILAGALLTACASGGGGAGYRAGTPELSSNLVVKNNSWDPVTVYVATSGQPLRVGSVDATSTRSFSLDSFRSAMEGRDAYLVARPLAGRPFRSEGFAFWPGHTTIWTIENRSALSQLVVR
jgi:hypothetical protein